MFFGELVMGRFLPFLLRSGIQFSYLVVRKLFYDNMVTSGKS